MAGVPPKPKPAKPLKPEPPEKLIFGGDFNAAMKELSLTRLTPLEVMHAIMFIKLGKSDYDGALAVAEKAAPFCHPKLTAAEVKVQHGFNGRTEEELAASIMAIREKLMLSQQANPAIDPVLQPGNPVIDLVPEPIQSGDQTVDRLDPSSQQWQVSAAPRELRADARAAISEEQTT